MSRIRIALALVAVAAVAAFGVGSALGANPKLTGTVGPDSSFTIKLTAL